ncbi:unnamed protein product [Microthlaspi erraticum]|uniref:Uncharacterized protein n=1 Tax=Microthlaspi erraticum TaxID=1685480 RepID=A0A6D2ISL2_9BRAS|nr:unnamed protein product [Microthlaspi erraticum]
MVERGEVLLGHQGRANYEHSSLWCIFLGAYSEIDHGIDLSSRTRSVQGQSPLLVWLEGVLLCRCGLARRLQVGCFKVGKKVLLGLQGDSLGGLSQVGGGA